ncbi:MAG: hypothetical protein ABIN89_29225 [Chitinophagaceae bacterium]
MRRNFFYNLYLFDKRLFFLVTIFSSLTIFCNIKGDEITPFFVWAMYSEKEDTANKYEIFKILVNDSVLVDYSSDYTDNNRFFLSRPLRYYNKIKQNGFVDPGSSFLETKLGATYSIIQPVAKKIFNGIENQEHFTGWYKKYLEQTMGMPIHAFKVNALSGHFTGDQQLQIDSSYLVVEWRQQ